MQDDLKALDVKKFKDIIQHESARMHLRSYSIDGETAFTIALALCAAVKKVFYEKSSMTFSDEPLLVKKPITQFAHRMRIDAMEKFNATTVFSVVKFSVSEEELQKQEYAITLIVYLEQKFLPDFLRLLQYPYIDSDEESEYKDGCGALANLFAGQYKKEMIKLGYKDFTMSHFESFFNTAVDGVEIPKAATEKFEISFEVEGIKRLVVELVTLASLPLRGGSK